VKDVAGTMLEDISASQVERRHTRSTQKDKSSCIDSRGSKALDSEKENCMVLRRDVALSPKFRPPGKTTPTSSQAKKKPKH
jgi:hypothetical protein